MAVGGEDVISRLQLLTSPPHHPTTPPHHHITTTTHHTTPPHPLGALNSHPRLLILILPLCLSVSSWLCLCFFSLKTFNFQHSLPIDKRFQAANNRICIKAKYYKQGYSMSWLTILKLLGNPARLGCGESCSGWAAPGRHGGRSYFPTSYHLKGLVGST